MSIFSYHLGCGIFGGISRLLCKLVVVHLSEGLVFIGQGCALMGWSGIEPLAVLSS